MKTVEYRDAWSFLDQYRGKDFQGKWPTVPELFSLTAKRFPDKTAFRAFDPDVSYTYKEALDVMHRVSRYLHAEGFVKGDKIAVSGKNSPEWALAYFAIMYAGCVTVPLDFTLHDHEMEHFIEFGDVKALFIDSDRIANIDKDGKLGIKKYSLEKCDGYDFILDLDGPAADIPQQGNSDVAAILFTSGTTGIPKGVMLTNDNLVSDCFETQANLDFSDSVIYAILPLHHAYTMEAVVYISISIGNTVVFGRKLAMSRIFKEIREGNVTVFMSVPMLYNKMIASLMAGVKKKGRLTYAFVRTMMVFSGFWQALTGKNIGKKLFRSLLEKLSFENIRVCISGGGPLPVSTFRMFNQLGVKFVQGYGLTEASPITHVNPVEAFRTASVGKRFPDVEVKIVNPDSDGNGLIYIKGPMVMKGYYKNPEATREVLTEDGWLNTGDVGYQDKDGYLYLTGRAKSVIITEGGKNVFPEEIEDQFQLFNELDQVCVIGYMADKAMKREGIRIILVPSKEYADSVGNDKTVIEKHLNELVDNVNRSLQSYKRITKVDVYYSPLPMTSTKKVKRNEVAKLFEDK